MPADTSILMGYRQPQIESIDAQNARAAQAMGIQQQNMLGQMQLAEMARANKQRNNMRDIFSNLDPNAPLEARNKLIEQAYLGSGDIAGLTAYKKSIAEADAAQANILKSQAQTKQANASTASSEYELNKKRIDHGYESIGNSRNPAEYRSNIYDALSKKLITQEQADTGLAQLAQVEVQDQMAGGNANFNKLRIGNLEKLLSAKDQLARAEPKYVFEDVGGKKVRIQTNPNAPDFDPKLVDLIKTPTIGETEIARHNKIMEAQGRQKTANETDPKNVAQTITDKAGNVTLLNKQGVVLSTLEGKGKPSATFEKTAQQQKQLTADRKIVISELEKVTKDGGLIDQSTGSGAGALLDSAARFGGVANKGDIAAGQLKPIADLAVKMVPRFEGPQSNADTASYTAAAGQLADPTLPREIRKAAGKEVLRIMKAREGQFGRADTESGNAAPPAGFVVDN